MKTLLDEYRRSLKMKEAEEVFDLLFYRPMAFVFVKAISRLPMTPNQVTVLSLMAGLLAAWHFSLGIHSSLVWAAAWFFAANILDCADGQLARLQNSGTLLGRVVDGLVDYISSIAIFLGIGIGLEKTGTGSWEMIVSAGLSSALHAAVFDYYQSEYIAGVRGERNFLHREMEKFIGEIVRMERERKDGIKVFFLQVYLNYLKLQKSLSTKHHEFLLDPQLSPAKNALIIRLWSFLGPTTNRTVLICCAVVGNVPLYLWLAATVGNVWLLICFFLQKKIHTKISAV
jgi:phosphatidylglycerophosphate synthase